MADNVAITAGAGTTIAADDVGGGVLVQRVKVSAGADGTATDTVTTKASANFNRPGDTTAYAANDGVSDNTTAGSVTKLTFTIAAGAGIIRRVKVRKSDQTVATPTIRVWFWDATFTVAAGDNAAFSNPLQDAIGFVDIAVTNAGTDDAVGWTNCDIPVAAGTVFCLLQTLSIFTPANAETFTVEIHYLPG